MHSYLRAIGFSESTTPDDYDGIIAEISRRESIDNLYDREDSRILIEKVFKTSQRAGVIMRGIRELDGKFHMDHIVPVVFHDPKLSRREEKIFVSKKIDIEAHTGLCEDNFIGISMIFHVVNEVEYHTKFHGEKEMDKRKVCFTGLSTSGKIILPTSQKLEDLFVMEIGNEYHTQLIEEARKGDEDAIITLTLEDNKMSEIVNDRAKEEDIYSIVSTSFIPFGTESDDYQVLGIIRTVSEETNEITGEKIWILQIDINSVMIVISINQKDLLGEPRVGRRFKGDCWLQGTIL